LNLLNDSDEAGTIGQVSVVQKKADARVMAILIQVINTIRVEETSATLYPVNDVPLVKEELSEVRAILAGYASNERYFI